MAIVVIGGRGGGGGDNTSTMLRCWMGCYDKATQLTELRSGAGVAYPLDVRYSCNSCCVNHPLPLVCPVSDIRFVCTGPIRFAVICCLFVPSLRLVRLKRNVLHSCLSSLAMVSAKDLWLPTDAEVRLLPCACKRAVVCVCAFVWACVHACMRACLHASVYAQGRMKICLCVCARARVCEREKETAYRW